MAVPGTRKIASGVQQAWIAVWGSDGFLLGGSLTAPAAGEVSHARRIYGVKELSPVIAEPERVQITGDDGLMGEMQYSNITSRGFTASVAASDRDLINLIQGTTTMSWGEARGISLDFDSVPNRSYAIWSNGRATSQGDSTGGRWNSLWVHLAELSWLDREAWTERTAANYRLGITPNPSSYDELGMTLNDSYAGVCNPRLAAWDHEYPLGFTRFTGNGVLATIPLGNTPVSAAKFAVAVNRVFATVNSISTTNKTVTLSSAPANNAVVEIIYEYDGDNC
jgi:hypothetical protein